MALKGQISVDEVNILEVTQDPRTDGAAAPLGSIALSQAAPYVPLFKNSAGDTGWTPIASSNEYYSVSATTSVATTATTYTQISGMTYTPPAGTYLVTLNASCNISGATGSANISLFLGSAQSAVSTQNIACNIALLGLITVSAFSISTSVTAQDIFTFNGTTAITGQFNCTSGTLTVGARILHLLRLG